MKSISKLLKGQSRLLARKLIFEFKLDKTLEAAFYQMQDKNYPEKYLSKKKI